MAEHGVPLGDDIYRRLLLLRAACLGPDAPHALMRDVFLGHVAPLLMRHELDAQLDEMLASMDPGWEFRRSPTSGRLALLEPAERRSRGDLFVPYPYGGEIILIPSWICGCLHMLARTEEASVRAAVDPTTQKRALFARGIFFLLLAALLFAAAVLWFGPARRACVLSH